MYTYTHVYMRSAYMWPNVRLRPSARPGSKPQHGSPPPVPAAQRYLNGGDHELPTVDIRGVAVVKA